MIVFFDAFTLKFGGGRKVILELINSGVNPSLFGIKKIILCGNFSQDEVEDYDWLELYTPKALKRSIPFSELFYRFISRDKKKESSDIIFAVGGTYPGKSHKYIMMSQNMLIFDKEERNNYFIGKTWLRLKLLAFLQLKAFKYSIGNIYITQYSRQLIESQIPESKYKPYCVTPYGASSIFFQKPKKQRCIQTYSKDKPFTLIYPSSIDRYKHQWNVIKAVALISKLGYNVKLLLCGKVFDYSEKFFNALNNNLQCTEYLGLLNENDLVRYYHQSDLMVFASSCETMGNIILEGMSAGLPIASSNCGPMPEILGPNSVYFDPYDVNSIYRALLILLNDPDLRNKYATNCYEEAHSYRWDRFASDIYSFLGKSN